MSFASFTRCIRATRSSAKGHPGTGIPEEWNVAASAVDGFIVALRFAKEQAFAERNATIPNRLAWPETSCNFGPLTVYAEKVAKAVPIHGIKEEAGLHPVARLNNESASATSNARTGVLDATLSLTTSYSY